METAGTEVQLINNGCEHAPGWAGAFTLQRNPREGEPKPHSARPQFTQGLPPAHLQHPPPLQPTATSASWITHHKIISCPLKSSTTPLIEPDPPFSFVCKRTMPQEGSEGGNLWLTLTFGFLILPRGSPANARPVVIQVVETDQPLGATTELDHLGACLHGAHTSFHWGEQWRESTESDLAPFGITFTGRKHIQQLPSEQVKSKDKVSCSVWYKRAGVMIKKVERFLVTVGFPVNEKVFIPIFIYMNCSYDGTSTR